MIKRLKRKVIALTMISLFVLLALMVAGMNLLNYQSVVEEADRTLSLLSQNRGTFPDMGQLPHLETDPFDKGFSPELPYESRYFSVSLDDSGNVIHIDLSKIAAVDSEKAELFAAKVQRSHQQKGFLGNYRYWKQRELNGVRITFLDCGRKLSAFRNFLFVSVVISLAGFAAVFVIIVFLSGRIIRPIAQSYEKQKRFITDAGHEIKTPLTIINANVDVLEMDWGSNECLEDVRSQTRRLTELTNDLILLTRMEEGQNAMPMIDFPASEVVSETAAAFQILADVQKKTLCCNVQPMVSMRGNGKSVEQLISILLDNAIKYARESSTINLFFGKQGKSIAIVVQNETETALNAKDLERIFDRFYRADLSRNSETGGYGIGLSVAKAIVTAHGGRIQATCPEKGTFRIIATFPD